MLSYDKQRLKSTNISRESVLFLFLKTCITVLSKYPGIGTGGRGLIITKYSAENYKQAKPE